METDVLHLLQIRVLDGVVGLLWVAAMGGGTKNVENHWVKIRKHGKANATGILCTIIHV